MPFEGRTLREVTQAHRESLNRLLAHTITRVPLIAVLDQQNDQSGISFRRGGRVSTAPIMSKYGPIELSLQQKFDTIEGEIDRVQLRVLEYQYMITPIGSDDPLLRWEFVRFPSSGSFWCRNHLQGPIPVAIGGRSVSLNDWHLPTGWVPVEEIIRFCIVDLGVPPLDQSVDADGIPEWHDRLIERHELSAAAPHA